MRLFIVAPMFSAMGSREIETRSQSWNDWWKKNGKSVRTRYGVRAWHLLDLLPGRDIQIGGTRPVRIVLPKDPESLVQKGLAVRFSILAALDWVDRHGIGARSDAVFSLMDGSGAFDFANINKLLDSLHKPPLPDIVFGLRPTGQSGMADWRKAIEEFENFLVLQKLPEESKEKWMDKGGLPDGQAGCWAFKMNSIKNLAISANSYEIEYDLLASSLLEDLNISFTEPLTMAARGATDFGEDPTRTAIDICMKKLDFIQYKLDLSESEILSNLALFRKLYADRNSLIPENYQEMVTTKYRPL